MVATTVSQLYCISPKAFQLITNINTEFQYTSCKLCMYKKEGIELIKEVASCIQLELNTLVFDVEYVFFVINKSNLDLIASKIQMLANMVKNLLGISAYKLWLLLDGYITDLQVVSKLLTDVR